jgi:uncharacterized protein YwgA
VRSKGAIKKGLKPLYEKFIRTQFGPFNEELWSDVRTLKEEGMIALEKCKIKLSEEARRLLLDASGKEAMKYLGEEAFNLNQIYPLEGMKEVDIGSELP